jgi:integrase
MAALLKHASEDLLPVIAIGGFAGVRSAEIARLEWRQLNFGSRTIEVLANGSKTGSRRLVPPTDNLAAWLAPYANRTGKIWPHSMAYLYEAIETAAQKASVVWKRNALRHCFASHRLAVVRNADQVALECGHSSRMLFRHYRELVTEELGHQWFGMAPATADNVVVLSTTNVVAVEKFGCSFRLWRMTPVRPSPESE